jgi:5'(3')-deoxyribonucleotidase
MDGVLADFFGEVAREHDVEYWREIHRKDLGIDQIAQKPGFFANLPPMPHAEQFMRGVVQISGKYSILSSPLMSDVEQSSEEKSEWLRRYLRRRPPQAIVFDHEKYKYARQADGTPNILIDDYDTNIRLWETNGGIGILYKDSDYRQVLHQLQRALHGELEPEPIVLAILEADDDDLADLMEPDQQRPGELYTSRQVLSYVKGIHHEYHLEKPILKHKVWRLSRVPLSDLKTPEYVHQDDPYRRVIDINWDHVADINAWDLSHRPVVADENGWVLDGNHRVTAARARGLESIPAFVPAA